MFTYFKKHPVWGIISALVLLVAGVMVMAVIGIFVSWGTAGDAEAAVMFYSTGLALAGAMLGAIGAATPFIDKDKPERSAQLSLEDRQDVHDMYSTFGWACVILGAGGSFIYQAIEVGRTALKIMPFIG